MIRVVIPYRYGFIDIIYGKIYNRSMWEVSLYGRVYFLQNCQEGYPK